MRATHITQQNRQSRPHRAALACAWVFGWVHIALFIGYACLAPGTMPRETSAGLTMVLCTGSTTVSITVDANGDPVETAHAPCEWSAAAAAAALTAPLRIAARAEYRAYAHDAAPTTPVIAPAPLTSHPARAPPHLL